MITGGATQRLLPILPPSYDEAVETESTNVLGKIHYFRQRHAPPAEFVLHSRADYHEVLQSHVVGSQMAILRRLQEHNAKHIFVEGMIADETRDCAATRRAELVDLVDPIIWNTRSTSPLPQAELRLLHDEGAALVYAALTKDAVIHPTMHATTADNLQKALRRRAELREPIVRLRNENIAAIEKARILRNEVAARPTRRNLTALDKKIRWFEKIYDIRNARLYDHIREYNAEKLELNVHIIRNRDRDCANFVIEFHHGHPQEDVFVVMGAQHRVPEEISALHQNIPIIIHDTADSYPSASLMKNAIV